MKAGWLFLLIVFFTACGNNKTTGDVGQVKDVNDFFKLFRPLKLPYSISDTSLLKPPKDSTEIPYEVFTQFVSDSILSNYFSKNVQPKIYALGKLTPKKAETYLFIKAINGTKRAAYLLVFDKEKKFT